MDLRDFTRIVTADIDSYSYNYVGGLIGRPLSPETIESEIRALRSALVEPYWVNVVRRDTFEQIKAANPPVYHCAVVADDSNGTILAFDPAKAEYLLIQATANGFESYGVNGDAVGCFMAR